MDCVPDFCNDIPVRFHGGVWIGRRVLRVGVGLIDHAFVVTDMDALDRNVIESLKVNKASKDGKDAIQCPQHGKRRV